MVDLRCVCVLRWAVTDVRELQEYLTNMRALGQSKPGLFALMLERQVQFALLPKLGGARADLEAPLWELLVLCLEGPESAPPTYNEDMWQQALRACECQTTLAGQEKAKFPTAAKAVVKSLDMLRNMGMLPPPKHASVAP